jgi:hypothetical protein
VVVIVVVVVVSVIDVVVIDIVPGVIGAFFANCRPLFSPQLRFS